MGLGTDSVWPDYVTAVPCTQRHAAEVFFAGNGWPQSLAYPGDNTVGNEAFDRCANTIAAYVGSIKYLGMFGFDVFSQTELPGPRAIGWWCVSRIGTTCSR